MATAAMICVLTQLLHEDIVIEIIVRCIKDASDETEAVRVYLGLRWIYRLFNEITDQKEVIMLLSYRAVREHFRYNRRRVPGWRGWPEKISIHEDRLREFRHREAICCAGMKMMVEQPGSVKGLQLVQEAAAAGDSWACYFLAMLRYRRDPADPQALEWIHGISGGPSPIDGRWESGGRMRSVRNGVQQELFDNAFRTMGRHDPPELLVPDPHICTWEECRRWGEGTFIIRYCSARCRIRHEYELWTRNFHDRVKLAVGRM